MKQTVLVKQENSLLTYAITKLNPDIFSHPVWIRFGYVENTALPVIVERLAKSAQELQIDNAAEACRLLLISSVLQNRSGEWRASLTSLQDILNLAKQAGLSVEVLWAYWGSCAICFQMEMYDQAAFYLAELESILNKQDEWVLAGFVNVIKQSLGQPEAIRRSLQKDFSDDSSPDDLLHLTYIWFQNWGISSLSSEPVVRRNRDEKITFEFFQKWRIKFNNGLVQVWHRSTIWKAIRSLLFIQAYGRKNEPAVVTIEQHDPVDRIPEPIIESSPIKTTSPAPNPPLKRRSKYPKKPEQIALTVQMLGNFGLTIQDASAKLPTSRALSVFKYLLLHYREDAPREVLMDLFWPDSSPEAARNNLNVAMHNLRQLLQKVTNLTFIQFEHGAYKLASNLKIWLDVEEFEHCVKEGQRLEAQNQLTAAVTEYEIAVNLYQGDFLADSPYESWAVLDRERLRIAYLDTLDHLSQIYFGQELYAACIRLCQLILNRDLCREDAHCRLMRCYSRLGQVPLALRQYQICVEALQEELDVEPAQETTQLFESISRREPI